MAKKSRVEQDPEPKPDMLPMIDIVFNLIIFFMIVSELSNLTVEQLQLAYASEAKDPPKGAATKNVDKMLVVNVMPDGLLKVRGFPYTDDPKIKAKDPNLPSFKEFLRVEVAGYEREPATDENPNPPSKMRINIRADKEVKFMYVQQVFDACSKFGVYKTSIAATKKNPEGG